MPTPRTLMRDAFKAADVDVALVATNRCTIFTDYGKGWKRYKFYGVGYHIPKASTTKLYNAIKESFPNWTKCWIDYHIEVTVPQ